MTAYNVQTRTTLGQFTMTAYTGQTRTTLGQLCAALWDSQSRPVTVKIMSGTITELICQAKIRPELFLFLLWKPIVSM